MGRTPSSAPDPLVRLFGSTKKADEGVGRGPGGPPHKPASVCGRGAPLYLMRLVPAVLILHRVDHHPVADLLRRKQDHNGFVFQSLNSDAVGGNRLDDSGDVVLPPWANKVAATASASSAVIKR